MWYARTVIMSLQERKWLRDQPKDSKIEEGTKMMIMETLQNMGIQGWTLPVLVAGLAMVVVSVIHLHIQAKNEA